MPRGGAGEGALGEGWGCTCWRRDWRAGSWPAWLLLTLMRLSERRARLPVALPGMLMERCTEALLTAATDGPGLLGIGVTLSGGFWLAWDVPGFLRCGFKMAAWWLGM